MASPKGKRWNGSIDTLPADYLKTVLEKMLDYGDRVQFSLQTGGSQPSYQVFNQFDKAMVFDRDHHIAQAQVGEFVGDHVSVMLTLDQIEAAIAGVLVKRAATRTVGTRSGAGNSGPRVTAAMLEEQRAAERYAYFKAHRATLPETIVEYSAEIAALMKNGIAVDAAYDEILKKHF